MDKAAQSQHSHGSHGHSHSHEEEKPKARPVDQLNITDYFKARAKEKREGRPEGLASGQMTLGGLSLSEFLRMRYIDSRHNSSMFNDYRVTYLAAFHQPIILAVLGLGAAAGLWLILDVGLVRTLTAAVAAILGLSQLGIIAALSPNMLRFKKRRGEFRDKFLGLITWTGDEQTLDVGCGSGFLVNAAAGKLTTGTATGIDLWIEDVGSGTRELLYKNAQSDGVADRIDIQRMDAREMSFDDNRFDLITSAWAVHHIDGGPDSWREVFASMMRMAKPGGTIAIADVEGLMPTIAGLFEEIGLEDVQTITDADQKGLFKFSLVTARKPG